MKIIYNNYHSRLCEIVSWCEYIKNYYLTLFFLLLFVTLIIIRTLYHVNISALSMYLFKMSIQNTLQHLNTTSFTESVFINYHKSIIENINIKQTSSANITTSKSMILNTLQINSNVVIMQAQLLILHNNFNLLIRDLLNKIFVSLSPTCSNTHRISLIHLNLLISHSLIVTCWMSMAPIGPVFWMPMCLLWSLLSNHNLLVNMTEVSWMIMHGPGCRRCITICDSMTSIQLL